MTQQAKTSPCSRQAPRVMLRAMKKLTIAAALVSLSIAAPVFACPDHDATPRTVDKAEKADKTQTAEKAKPAKQDKAKAKPAEKADKVSQK